MQKTKHEFGKKALNNFFGRLLQKKAYDTRAHRKSATRVNAYFAHLHHK